MSAMPTADDVARAIVAAARETGENPIDCAMKVRSSRVSGRKGMYCRHYAMHALAELFPSIDKGVLASFVGPPIQAKAFWYSSLEYIYRPMVLNRSRRRARWWDESAFERIIAVVRAGMDLPRAPAPTPLKPPDARLTWNPGRDPDFDRDAKPPIVLRKTPSDHFADLTSALMGDPPADRSALMKKKPQPARVSISAIKPRFQVPDDIQTTDD